MTRRAAISLVCLLAVAGPTGAARRPAPLFADLVVLSHDYLTVPVDRVKMITPILTMVGGKVVFERSDLAKRVSPEGARARSGSSTGT